MGILMLISSLFFLSGVFIDDRMITGAPAWLKPTKFAISIAFYTLTFSWILGFVQTDKRWKQRLVTLSGGIISTVFVLEMLPITIQVIRGTTSHFNYSTPFDTFLFNVMGAAIMTLFITHLVVTLVLVFQRFDNPAFALALRAALIISLIGMSFGYLMSSPTAQQLAQLQAGETLNIIGAHTVGAPDGSASIPVLYWSRTGGDLRIGHFVGMHALQLLPLLGWLITTRTRLQQRQQQHLILISALTYLSMTLLVTWQALRAQPITAPDALTLSVFSSILLLSIISTLIVLRPKPQTALT